MSKAMADFGLVVLYCGLIPWAFLLVIRIVGEWNNLTLLAEAVFSVFMSVGFLIFFFASLFMEGPGSKAVLNFLGGLAPAVIPLGLTMWMVGFYIRNAGDYFTGEKVVSLGKAMFKTGLLLTLVIMVCVFIAIAVKDAGKHRPSRAQPPQYKVSDI